MNIKSLILEYFHSTTHMQLATALGNQPWVSTVYYVVDDDLNIYWTSTRSRRHSIEIKENPHVAATIVKDSVLKQALQITGTAEEVSEEKLEMVQSLYKSAYSDTPDYASHIRGDNSDGRAFWVLRPSQISLWDEVNFGDAPKQEYYLKS